MPIMPLGTAGLDNQLVGVRTVRVPVVQGEDAYLLHKIRLCVRHVLSHQSLTHQCEYSGHRHWRRDGPGAISRYSAARRVLDAVAAVVPSVSPSVRALRIT